MNTGTITLIQGPMFSGKTTSLIKKYKKKSQSENDSILITHGLDTRYTIPVPENLRTLDTTTAVYVRTHSIKSDCNNEFVLAYKINNIEDLNMLLSKNKNIKNIYIDEVQFFEESFYKDLQRLVFLGYNVIAAGLNRKYNRDKFITTNLIKKSSDIIYTKTARCEYCENKAHYTVRKSSEIADVVIGGVDKYAPVCLECHTKHNG